MKFHDALAHAHATRASLQDNTAKMVENAEKANDWYATCPKCKQPLRGTLKEIREHKCGK